MALLTPLSLPEARAQGSRFGLDIVRIEALALGSVNSNFRLHAADGSSYFARLYEEQPLQGARAEAQLLLTLHGEGVPVARPLLTLEGEAILELCGKPFAVFPWVRGEWLCLARVTAQHCYKLGAALARVHLASAQVQALPEGRFRPEDMQRRLEEVQARGAPELDTAIAAIRSGYAKHLAERVSLPVGICHGDLFRDNVLWNGEELAALLDFESAAWGSFMYDLMVTVLAWCFEDGFVSGRVAALFEGYVSVRIPSDIERRALETEGALACLRFAVTRITDFELRRAPGQPPGRDYRRFLTRLAALEAGALGSPSFGFP